MGKNPRWKEENGPPKPRFALHFCPLVQFQAFLKMRHYPKAYYEISRPRHARRTLRVFTKGMGGREIPDYSRKHKKTSLKLLPL